MKAVIKYVIFAVVVLLAVLLMFIIFSTYKDYQPAPRQTLLLKQTDHDTVHQKEFNMLIWNVGYCGLDKDMDFFYDGGKNVRPTMDVFQDNLNHVYNFLSQQDSIDFILLQEVDSCAKRSYYVNETDVFADGLIRHKPIYCLNYKVRIVPMPFMKPMGEVNSGILSFFKYPVYLSERYSYPANYGWPMKVFMLDRCFQLNRIQLADKHDLVVINLHNSPYDDAADLRFYELSLLRGMILNEYSKGNYVVVGGDWNMCPGDYDNFTYLTTFKKKEKTAKIPDEFFPENWHWGYDKTIPTNREVYQPYVLGETPTSTIDFFLCSPNVTIESVKAINLNFEYTDHQPVWIKFRLDENPENSFSPQQLEYVNSLKDSILTINKK